jgi:hypothetical protein
VKVTGVSEARKKLAELSKGLRDAASGEVARRAAEKVGSQVRKVAASKLSAHNFTGAAAANTVVDVDGPLVQLHGMPSCLGKQWEGKSYLSTFDWWPFRSGYMPPFIVNNAIKIFEAELVAALSGQRSPLLVAEEAAEAAAAKKRAKKVAREQREADRHRRAVEREKATRAREMKRIEREARSEARRGRRPE